MLLPTARRAVVCSKAQTRRSTPTSRRRHCHHQSVPTNPKSAKAELITAARKNRRRHLPTVAGDTPHCAATCLFARPCAQFKTIRERNANAWEDLRRRSHLTSCSRSESLNSNACLGRPVLAHTTAYHTYATNLRRETVGISRMRDASGDPRASRSWCGCTTSRTSSWAMRFLTAKAVKLHGDEFHPEWNYLHDQSENSIIYRPLSGRSRVRD